ncbi:MAG: ATP-binding cassette domain-containing protein [Bacillota bacterium]
MSRVVVRMEGVRKRYGAFTLSLDEFLVEQGYVLGLVGPNGAGKSTTIRIMLNLTYPEAGRVEVLGLEQPGQELEIKRRVGYVSETPNFYEDMTPSGLGRLVSSYYPTWDARLYQEYLARFF